MNAATALDAGSLLRGMLPEVVLAAGIPAVLVTDLLVPARRRVPVLVGAVAAAAAALLATTAPAGPLGALATVDPFAALVRVAAAGLAALLLLVHAGEGRATDRAAFTVGVLGIALGAAVTGLSTHLLPLWLGLETVSLAGYTLVAGRPGDRRGAEAGMKFVLFGSLASALSLFGASHVYGLTGHLDFQGIASALASMPLAAGFAVLLFAAGLVYKLALVPFHVYAPDVYAGATPTALVGVALVPKLAAIAALARVCRDVLPGGLVGPPGFADCVAVLASVSILGGALFALRQTDGKRILALSGVGHAGAAVLALACQPAPGALAATAFQGLGYVVATAGALLALAVFEADRGSCRFADLAGAGRDRPVLFAAFVVCLLSLAGLPPFAGFFAKWWVLLEALRHGLEPAGRPAIAVGGLVLIVATAAAAWAYLQVLRALALQATPARTPAAAALPSARLTTAVVVGLALLAMVGGVWLDDCRTWFTG